MRFYEVITFYYFVTNWDISVNCNLIHSNHVFFIFIWSREKDADVSWVLVMDMGMFIRSTFPSFSLALTMISLLKRTFMITPDLPFPGQWPPCNAGQHHDLQPVFAILPCVFLPASEDSQVTQSPIQNTHGPKALDPQRATESDRKD